MQRAPTEPLENSPAGRDLAHRLAVDFLDDLSALPPSADFTSRVPITLARHYGVVGFAREHEAMRVAISSMDQMDAVDVIERWAGGPLDIVVSSPEAIATAINRCYQARDSDVETVIRIGTESTDDSGDTDILREDLLAGEGRAPVIRLINSLLFEAVRQRASDIHFQPYEDKLVARLRIDGVLFDAYTVPKSLQEEANSRVKVLGRMDIAEKRLPQDGRATVQVGDRLVDLRIASMPSSFGERIVIRLLDKAERLFRLPELGMDGQLLSDFIDLLSFENGLLLVTGPTGSGKSTTLYAALQELNSKEKNIVTLEDPIEYQLDGVSQVQVSDKRGMTFARGLRSVVRQDPDIIMVGEIRDGETAQMAIQASLTGHLVFSTLHTNSASSAITRLLDLGVEPYLAASTIVGVLAQRLVRRICKNCAETVPISELNARRLHMEPGTEIQQGKGCSACRNTGYVGRLGLFELLVIDEPIRQFIQRSATASEIEKYATSHGMRLLREHGRQRILAGQTTPQEVERVTTRATV